MKRFLLYVLLCVCPLAYADILLTEDFDYPVGTPLTACGWTAPYGNTTSITITNGLIFNDYFGSNTGNAALIKTKTGSAQPHLKFKSVPQTGDVYVTFMFQPSIVAKKGYFFSLRDDKTTEYNFMGRVSINEDYRLGLTFGDNQKAVYAAEILDGQRVYLVVLRYSMLPDANDQVSLYAFPTMPTEQPEKPLIGPLSDAGKPDIQPANIVLRGYDNNSWLVIDGIRVATTWEEAVARTSATDLPQTTSANTTKAYKRMENGQLIVIRGNKKYNALGKEI